MGKQCETEACEGVLLVGGQGSGRPKVSDYVKLKSHGIRFSDVEWAALVSAAGGPRKASHYLRQLLRLHLGLPGPEEKCYTKKSP